MFEMHSQASLYAWQDSRVDRHQVFLMRAKGLSTVHPPSFFPSLTQREREREREVFFHRMGEQLTLRLSRTHGRTDPLEKNPGSPPPGSEFLRLYCSAAADCMQEIPGDTPGRGQ